MRRQDTLLASCIALILVSGVACSGLAEEDGGNKELSGARITVAGAWTGSEQKNFQKVLDAFSDKTGAKVTFVSTGNNVSTAVGGMIEDGDAPDVALLPQLGVLGQFERNGWLEPLSVPAREAVDANYADVWREYGSVNGTLYGVYYKVAHKSAVWYNPRVFVDANVGRPATFAEMLSAGQAISDSGLAAFAIAGRDGWTLTDWFENVYLSQAGPQKYDALAAHELKWTDASVVEALTSLGKLFKEDHLIAGGREGALNTDFPGSVEMVFGTEPEAGMVFEGDFVAGIAKDRFGKEIGQDVRFFSFPAREGGIFPVISGGDAAVVLKGGKNSAAGMKLVEYLATAEAAAVWAKLGGFLSPNKQLDIHTYDNLATRAMAESLVDAEDRVRFDMSDQAPASFGGTNGASQWRILQSFLRDPSDPESAAAELEEAAAKAYQD
ncbi:ABC transporter substrate-binding protein [Streptomyces chartreusis]|uniref:Carbohydrate ABC transporter substrate-binding protein n=1 Tax=Streptomyces chartreusis TaxID=1969 RepID=A0A7H8TJB1_STRCX|nr:ABC transporter substrate-binding protein [Streptomyces chartreusis]QKZ23337.1 carbohydrate ABC transporter substrate-binding protein [Streptomyces chartreusis]